MHKKAAAGEICCIFREDFLQHVQIMLFGNGYWTTGLWVLEKVCDDDFVSGESTPDSHLGGVQRNVRSRFWPDLTPFTSVLFVRRACQENMTLVAENDVARIQFFRFNQFFDAPTELVFLRRHQILALEKSEACRV